MADQKYTKVTTAMVQQAVKEDDVLRKHAKNLAQLAMTEAVNVLVNGHPAAKAAMAAKFVPAIVRAIESEHVDDEMATMRREYMKMMDEIGGNIFGEGDEEVA